MISITPEISLDENELNFEFVRSSGPGGQNVNKVSTAAQLRFDVKHSPNLRNDLRERIIKLAGRKMTREGVLIIHANTFRSQEKNREDALRRLSNIIREASLVPRQRKKPNPLLHLKPRDLNQKEKKAKSKRCVSPSSILATKGLDSAKSSYKIE